jgi:hypothetical protein
MIADDDEPRSFVALPNVDRQSAPLRQDEQE